MKPTTSVKPGNHTAATAIASSTLKMKYLSGQRESYTLRSRKKLTRKKTKLVQVERKYHYIGNHKRKNSPQHSFLVMNLNLCNFFTLHSDPFTDHIV